MFKRITNQLIKKKFRTWTKIVLDGSRYNNEYIDKYYLKIREYYVKHYIKNILQSMPIKINLIHTSRERTSNDTIYNYNNKNLKKI